MRTGDKLFEYDAISHQFIQSLDVPCDNYCDVLEHDGRDIAFTIRSNDGIKQELVAIQLSTGKQRVLMHSKHDGFSSVALSPSGDYLAVFDSQNGVALNNDRSLLRIYSIRAQTELELKKEVSFDGEIRKAGFVEERKLLLGLDSGIALLDLRSGQVIDHGFASETEDGIVSFSPIAIGKSKDITGILIGTRNGSVEILAYPSLNSFMETRVHKGPVWAVQAYEGILFSLSDSRLALNRLDGGTVSITNHDLLRASSLAVVDGIVATSGHAISLDTWAIESQLKPGWSLGTVRNSLFGQIATSFRGDVIACNFQDRAYIVDLQLAVPVMKRKRSTNLGQVFVSSDGQSVAIPELSGLSLTHKISSSEVEQDAITDAGCLGFNHKNQLCVLTATGLRLLGTSTDSGHESFDIDWQGVGEKGVCNQGRAIFVVRKRNDTFEISLLDSTNGSLLNSVELPSQPFLVRSAAGATGIHFQIEAEDGTTSLNYWDGGDLVTSTVEIGPSHYEVVVRANGISVLKGMPDPATGIIPTIAVHDFLSGRKISILPLSDITCFSPTGDGSTLIFATNDNRLVSLPLAERTGPGQLMQMVTMPFEGQDEGQVVALLRHNIELLREARRQLDPHRDLDSLVRCKLSMAANHILLAVVSQGKSDLDDAEKLLNQAEQEAKAHETLKHLLENSKMRSAIAELKSQAQDK